ncbi:MAG: carbamoyltransferase [Fibrobacteria bacterium]|jgi:carbamoyltransferase|nr:carbamoyltransferase [Fibrobacteria bacterium]
MRILGLGCHYHDASASLLVDGRIVAAADEERFTRLKHDPSFPKQAVEYCLREAGIGIGDLDAIAFYEKPLVKFERLLTQHAGHYPFTFGTFRKAMPSWITEKLRLRKLVRKNLGYEGEVYYLDHHLSHAAGAFYPSPFDEAAVLTVDGVGEWTTTGLGMGRGTALDLTHEIRFPDSIGLLYSTVTAYLGFSVNNSEYKVMGLSAYGEKDPARNPWYPKMRRVIDLKPDGSYRLDRSYFDYEHAERMPSKKFCALFGGPPRAPEAPVEKRHEDIAAAVQLVTEEAVFAMLGHLHRLTGCPNVVLSGGVALNSVMNGKILSETPFEKVWIQPNSGDGGSSMGAALYVYHALMSHPRSYRLDNPFIGPGFSAEEVEAFLKERGIAYHRYPSREALLQDTARRIAGNEIVGWFQGRGEWGPRALGARSILSNAGNPAMRDILNLKVKHREAFRPFAPSVRAEEALKYFECDEPLPLPADFMLMVYPVRPEWRARLAAVTHVDGSGRLQAVQRAQHPLYYDLIGEVGKITGVGVVINTSFNVRGEPIVATPEQAYRCMMGTAIDCLVMEDFLILRSENARDAWDSEALPGD